MLIEDKTGFKVNLQVFNDGEEITEEFFEEFAEKKDGDTLLVDQSVECIMKVMRFLNRLGEYNNVESNLNDYAMINPTVSSAPSVCVAASCRSDVPSAITSAVSASIAGVAGRPVSHAGGVVVPEPLFNHFLRRYASSSASW